MGILEAIGNTPLVRLERVVPPGSARIVAKLEWANPTGSMKDRMARAAVEQIEGIGIGFLPPLWEPEQVDEIVGVSTAEAKAMARRLAREEGIFAGISSGANIVAALRLARCLGPGATVATIIVDSGVRYLSTDVYRSEAASETTGVLPTR